MAENPDAAIALPGIAVLPPTTVRQISSSQVIIDPSSIVKELIDNALDARATAIFVEITSNTIDSISVRDTGHGIPQEDQPLACRRYYTSKIRDFKDLKEIGGKWLGFRGEALASMAEVSGALEITTRVEGEPIAFKMKYGRNGELSETERSAAPVGTTVKATDLFKHIPVRKQTTIKNSTKYLAKIQRMIQGYALVRPNVRFNFCVRKAKSTKFNLTYAPKQDASVEDAIIKVISKDCSLQCDWTLLDTDGFEICAYLPRPSAIASKIASKGAFMSVDGRPVSTGRGVLKRVANAFKERLRKSSLRLAAIKEPFFYMNIVCPPRSYDPNVEPAKDDVLFEDGDLIMAAVDKLLVSYYPEANIEDEEVVKEVDPTTSAHQHASHGYIGSLKQTQSPIVIHEDTSSDDDRAEDPSESRQGKPQWRSNMYGIDEEDFEFITENQTPVIEEEEEERRAAKNSNPWVIAAMNARKKKPVNNGQFMIPAKTQGGDSFISSSPIPVTNSRKIALAPLTPQFSSRSNIMRPVFDEQNEGSIARQHFPHSQNLPSSDTFEQTEHKNSSLRDQRRSEQISKAMTNNQSSKPASIAPQASMLPSFGSFTSARNTPGHPMGMTSSSSPAPLCTQHKQQPRNNRFNQREDERPDDDWFGRPMRGSAPKQAPARRRKLNRNYNLDEPMFSQNEEGDFANALLTSKNNTDIRDFFGRGRARHQDLSFNGPSPIPSFTPINIRPLDKDQPVAHHERFSRASSLDAPNHSQRTQTFMHSQSRDTLEPTHIAGQLRIYAEQEGTSHSIFAESSVAPHRGLPNPPMLPGQSLEVANVRTSTLRKDLVDQLHAHVNRGESTRAQIPQNSPANPPSRGRSVTRSLRLQSSDGLRRRRSSRLPLERVPHGDRIHNLQLHVNVGIEDILHHIQKIDMGVAAGNSLEWHYPSSEFSFNVFGGLILDETVTTWTANVVSLLNHVYERDDCAYPELRIVENIRKQLRDRCGVKPADDDPDDLERVAAWTQQVIDSSPILPSQQGIGDEFNVGDIPDTMQGLDGHVPKMTGPSGNVGLIQVPQTETIDELADAIESDEEMLFDG